MSKYLTEFIGTFFLVLTIGLVVKAEKPISPVEALPIGAVLMVMVYMGGHISGAHYNPAVSLAVLVRGRLSTPDFVRYVVAQLAGAVAASYVVFIILGKTFPIAPGAGVSQTTALLVEILYTFALALVVLNVATAKKTEGNSYYGLAIGFTVLAGAFAGGPVSGGAFNPAVGTGAILVHALHGGGTFGDIWIYLVGPFAGGVLAAQVFKYQESGST